MPNIAFINEGVVADEKSFRVLLCIINIFSEGSLKLNNTKIVGNSD